jgi:hypothetical protein
LGYTKVSSTVFFNLICSASSFKVLHLYTQAHYLHLNASFRKASSTNVFSDLSSKTGETWRELFKLEYLSFYGVFMIGCFIVM